MKLTLIFTNLYAGPILGHGSWLTNLNPANPQAGTATSANTANTIVKREVSAVFPPEE